MPNDTFTAFPTVPHPAGITDQCPSPCWDCKACFWRESGHHWVEVDRDEELGDYQCKNCGRKAPWQEVFREEQNRGGTDLLGSRRKR